MGHLQWVGNDAIQVSLEPDVRLKMVPELIKTFGVAYRNGARRIELDVTNVKRISEAARHVIEVAAARLAERGVTLELVDQTEMAQAA